ncbi:MAG: CAP domain-containing protein [Pseudomonadota bacterium]
MRRFMFWLVVSIWSSAMPGHTQELLDNGTAAQSWINEYRAKNGRSALQVSQVLTKIAAQHAHDMSRHGFFSHTGSDGSSISDRARDAGYQFCIIAENIAKGQTTLGDVLNAWRNSKGHRQNMLQSKAREFAVVQGAGDTWVMVIGSTVC